MNLETLTILIFLLTGFSGISCNSYKDGIVSLVCPNGWVADGQAWYGPQRQSQTLPDDVYSTSKYVHENKTHYLFLSFYELTTYMTCLICKIETDHSQKWIEICVTNSGFEPIAKWHYENEFCNVKNNFFLDWCRKNPMCGINVHLYHNKLLKILQKNSPIPCEKSYNQSLSWETNVSNRTKDLSLICPVGTTIERIETRNTLCDDQRKTESPCLICRNNQTEISICAPQNCTNINMNTNFNKLIQTEKSCQISNETKLKNKFMKCIIDPPLKLLQKICGIKLEYSNGLFQAPNQFNDENLIFCNSWSNSVGFDKQYIITLSGGLVMFTIICLLTATVICLQIKNKKLTSALKNTKRKSLVTEMVVHAFEPYDELVLDQTTEVTKNRNHQGRNANHPSPEENNDDFYRNHPTENFKETYLIEREEDVEECSEIRLSEDQTYKFTYVLNH